MSSSADRRRRSGSGELLANLQVAQLFIGGGKLGDIAHIDTVLVQDAAERIAGRHHIFVPAGIAIGFFVELILRNGFFFLRGLIDRLGGFRQQGTDLAFSSSMVLTMGADSGW